MTATLATLTDRVELMIADETNVKFSTTAIAEGIRQALHRYSKKRPRRSITTLTIPADGREVSVASITGLLDVSEVWLPYTASSPEEPPNRLAFELWYDEKLLYFPSTANGGYEPQAGEVARIFYTRLHTLDGLDSATATTLPPDDETLLAIGGAAYAVLAQARRVSEAVTLADQVPLSDQVIKWSRERLREFEAGLNATAARGQGVPWVSLPPMDRWDRNAGGWS
jgi:hypothetical protein